MCAHILQSVTFDVGVTRWWMTPIPLSRVSAATVSPHGPVSQPSHRATLSTPHKQPQPPLPPSCNKHTAAPWSLCFPSGRTRPDRHFLRRRAVSPSPGHRRVLTDTDSLRHSQASGAPLLFWPTRKSPRQATPPPRHREQQHGDWRRTRKQMATPGGNDRFGNGDGRKRPRRAG